VEAPAAIVQLVGASVREPDAGTNVALMVWFLVTVLKV